MPHDAEGGRDIIEHFADHGAGLQEVATAAGRTGAISNLVDFVDTWQMLR